MSAGVKHGSESPGINSNVRMAAGSEGYDTCTIRLLEGQILAGSKWASCSGHRSQDVPSQRSEKREKASYGARLVVVTPEPRLERVQRNEAVRWETQEHLA